MSGVLGGGGLTHASRRREDSRMLRVQLLAFALLLTSFTRAGLAAPAPTDETATYAALPATDAERASIQRSLASAS